LAAALARWAFCFLAAMFVLYPAEEGTDGKSYLTDAATAETLLRLVQSVPSPKAESIKLWLAKEGSQLVTNCYQLKNRAEGGHARKRSAAVGTRQKDHMNEAGTRAERIRVAEPLDHPATPRSTSPRSCKA
jgi:hypothetical protein